MNNYKKNTCLLSVDLGTTSMKFGLFDAEGRLLSYANQEYKLSSPQWDWLEMEEETYLQAFIRGIKELRSKTKIPLLYWKSICFSSQGQTFFVLDKKGQVLYPAIVWLDSRAQDETREIAGAFSRTEYYEKTGSGYFSSLLSAGKILWLKKHRPRVIEKAHKYLMLKDYFIYRLTGNQVSDPTILASSGMFDTDKKVFWKSMLSFVGVKEEQLAAVREPGEIAGEVTPEAAQKFGLTKGMTVLTGGMDQSFSALGAGNYRESILTVNIGTCLSLYATTDRRVLDPEFRLLSGRHLVKDKFFVLPFVQTAGMVLKWFRDNLAVGQTYAELSQLAAAINPGADGLIVLPHFSGVSCPHSNPAAKGVFYGITLGHTRSHLVRAIMEAVVFAMLENLEVLEELEVKISGIRAIGGGSESKVWMQIIADAMGLSVVRPELRESALLGGAILSAVTLGIKKNIAEAVNDFCRRGDTFKPNPKNYQIYRQAYEKYRELYDKLYGGTCPYGVQVPE